MCQQQGEREIGWVNQEDGNEEEDYLIKLFHLEINQQSNSTFLFNLTGLSLTEII